MCNSLVVSCICVLVCVCAHVECVHAHMHTYISVEVQGQPQKLLRKCWPVTLFFEAGSLTWSGTDQIVQADWLASLSGASCVCLHSTGVTSAHHYAQPLCVGSGAGTQDMAST